jgi:hypothetical protein
LAADPRDLVALQEPGRHLRPGRAVACELKARGLRKDGGLLSGWVPRGSFEVWWSSLLISSARIEPPSLPNEYMRQHQFKKFPPSS